ncbi:MAG TPA: hydrogenase maturation protease [Stellaceae bacterium]|nr:hydrogenase maturation protease [Stellaceae bacterium]
MSHILIAGIGNVFKGDDGFGVAVAAALAPRPLPPEVRLVDFGIRGLDLVYALLDDCSAAILIDAVARGEPPGTLSIIEPEPGAAEEAEALLAPHAMDPQRVLRLAALLGGGCRQVMLVGCEPLSFGDPEFGAEGLSAPVAAAVPRAADLVEGLVRELSEKEMA